MKKIKEALRSTLPLAGLHSESLKSREVRRQGPQVSIEDWRQSQQLYDALPPLKQPNLQISHQTPWMRGLESLWGREITGPLAQPPLGP